MSKVFILYDGRAKSGDTDDATVMCTAHSEAEAERDSRTTFARHDAIWFEYDMQGKQAVNEKRRDDIGRKYLL